MTISLDIYRYHQTPYELDRLLGPRTRHSHKVKPLYSFFFQINSPVALSGATLIVLSWASTCSHISPKTSCELQHIFCIMEYKAARPGVSKPIGCMPLENSMQGNNPTALNKDFMIRGVREKKPPALDKPTR